MVSSRRKTVVFWSTGKDAALMVQRLQAEGKWEIAELVTMVNEPDDRVAMHGLRSELRENQLKQIGLPAETVRLPFPCPNSIYENRVKKAVDRWKMRRIEHAHFADLFVEDIRKYRDALFHPMGIETHYPLWGENTRLLAEEMIETGIEAVLTCVDTRSLPSTWAGRKFDRQFLESLPNRVDPCGENGEFHTFVTNASYFSSVVKYTLGSERMLNGFCYRDLIPA